jgi:deoxyribonuclease-4
MIMVVHGSYTINLSHPSNSPKYKASLKSLIQDLDSSVIIGERCLGVIIHMGKNIPDNKISNRQALDNYIYGIKQALKETQNSTIILETGASQGNEVGSSIDGLTYIYWSFDEKERERIMFCIDTCHIWATGYDISNSSGVKNFFKEFDEKIGIEKISVIHFNDSKTGLNSHVDRHADLGYGHISDTGLRQVAKFAKKHKIPLVMETPLDAIDTNTNQEITFEDEFQRVLSWIK